MFTENFTSQPKPGDYITCQVGAYKLRAYLIKDEQTSPYDFGRVGYGYYSEPSPCSGRAREITKLWQDGRWRYCGIEIEVECAESGDLLADDVTVYGLIVDGSAIKNRALLDAANLLIDEAIEQAEENSENEIRLNVLV